MALLSALWVVAAVVQASDWPQYRGVNQDGVSAESLKWSGGELKGLWKVPINTGFSSFAVAAGKVFTQVVKDTGGK